MSRIRVLNIVYFSLCFLLFSTQNVHAYIDPATTSYIIQIVAAMFITLGVTLTAFTTKAKLFFLELRMKFIEEKVRREAGTSSTDSDEPQAGTIKYLFYDKRRFISRAVPAAICAFAFSFTFIIFGCFDLYIQNQADFPFSISDMLAPTIIAGIIVFALLFIILIILKGKMFNYAISLFIGLLLAGYIQGNFLNLDFGELMGSKIPWELYGKHMLINTMLWALMTLIPFIILYFNKYLWKIACTYILPTLLILVQIVALVFGFASSDLDDKDSRYLSKEGIYEVASEENIIWITIDAFDIKYTDILKKEYENYNETFSDFTLFTNFLTEARVTYPSMINMFTGAMTKYEEPADDFATKAYEDGALFPGIKDAGYNMKLYMTNPYTYTNINQVDEFADNVSDSGLNYYKTPIMKYLLNLSAYRYAPHVMKPSFWASTKGDFPVEELAKDKEPYVVDDISFYSGMSKDGLSIDKDIKKGFAYYHLNGAHLPYTVDENVKQVNGDEGTLEKQLLGSAKILEDFLNEMKANGIYDDSMIIIAGDHGEHMGAEKYPNVTALYVKMPNSNITNGPAINNYSVDPGNLRATILDYISAPNNEKESTLFQANEMDNERYLYYRIWNGNGKPLTLETFRVIGDAKEKNNWELIDTIEVKYQFP